MREWGAGMSHGIDPTREQLGVIYVEALVGMFILALVLLAMVPLLTAAAHENGAARDVTFATAAAQAKAEELKVVDFNTLAGGNETLAHNNVTYTRSWVVQNDKPATGMKSVSVTVTANRGNTLGGARPVEVTFYRTAR